MWANNKYLCNYIVRQYFKGTCDVISVTMARRKVHKQTLIFSVIVDFLKNLPNYTENCSLFCSPWTLKTVTIETINKNALLITENFD